MSMISQSRDRSPTAIILILITLLQNRKLSWRFLNDALFTKCFLYTTFLMTFLKTFSSFKRRSFYSTFLRSLNDVFEDAVNDVFFFLETFSSTRRFSEFPLLLVETVT